MAPVEVSCPMPGWPPEWLQDGRIRFAGVSGGCHRGHARCIRQLKREQAEYRNGLSRPRNRKVNRGRVKRPKQTTVSLIACPWPHKIAHPDKESARRALRIARRENPGEWRTAEVYACPAANHFHIGNRPAEGPRDGRTRRPDRERREAA